MRLCEKNQTLNPPRRTAGRNKKLERIFTVHLFSRFIPPCVRRPNLVDGLSLGTQTTVVPFSIDELIIKAKACAHARIVSREKGDGFHVFSSLSTVSSSTCARKLPSFGVEGHPLESTSTENFDGPSRPGSGSLDLVFSFSSRNHPVARKFIFAIR